MPVGVPDTATLLWDWLSKMGLGGLLVWLIQRWVGKRDKATERGRQLVDDARPELVPRSNLGTQYVVALEVENRGKGTASTLRIEFTGVPAMPTMDDVPPGRARQTATLNVHNSPFFTAAHDGHGEITLVYADRFGNEYSMILPVGRQQRNDSGFNMIIDRHNCRTVEPTLTKKRLREIGRI